MAHGKRRMNARFFRIVRRTRSLQAPHRAFGGEVGSMAQQNKPRKRILRTLFSWLGGIVLAIVLLAVAAFVIAFWTPLHHRFVEFPAQAKEWQRIRNSRIPTVLDSGWTEFRGVCHSHSKFSHDSDVEFPEILAAAKTADISFIFMSDHCTNHKADYSKQWRGMHDGVLFSPGFEMEHGFMPWGLPSETVLDSSTEEHALAAQIHQAGGLLFFAHSEETRLWDLPELNGMEIYNIHSDVKENGYGNVFKDAFISLNKYPDQVFRTLYHRQTDILKHWDDLNRSRKLVGIGANDCHRNNGFQGFYTDHDTFLVKSNAPDDEGKEYKLNALTRTLLRLFPGSLEPGARLFRFELDPYERSIRFTNTHLLARELTEPALLDALKEGRAFVAFDMIADARGFVFVAQDSSGAKATMGQTIPLSPELKLKAESPYEVRFTLYRDGHQETEQTGRAFEYAVPKPGKYRLEAALKIDGQWTDWLFTNPIEVTPQNAAPAPAPQT
jgi:hypothetical protein